MSDDPRFSSLPRSGLVEALALHLCSTFLSSFRRRAKRNFQPRRWIEAKTRKLNDYLRRAGLSGCVVSVSGGVDSAVTYALMIEASKLPDSPLRKTIGIAQPIHSTKSVWKRAFELRAIGGQIICT